MSGRILVLGGSGMVGHKLFDRLRREFDHVFCTLHRSPEEPPFDRIPLFHTDCVIPNVDVFQMDRVCDLLRSLRPDVVVNCVGVIKQRDAARAPIPSIRINALLPHELAELCAGWGGRLIHFSTDCVFSGRKGAYSEHDPSDAEDLYGKSKFLGEVVAPNAITLRTSIIGRELTEHRSLLDWFLSQNGGSVRGFRRVIYSGITTNEMANVVTKLVRDLPALSGTFQVASDPISKFELLGLIRDAYGLDIEIIPDDTEVSDRSMIGQRFTDASGWRAPSWPEMVRDLAADATPYDAWGIPVPNSKRMEPNSV